MWDLKLNIAKFNGVEDAFSRKKELSGNLVKACRYQGALDKFWWIQVIEDQGNEFMWDVRLT